MGDFEVRGERGAEDERGVVAADLEVAVAEVVVVVVVVERGERLEEWMEGTEHTTLSISKEETWKDFLAISTMTWSQYFKEEGTPLWTL